MLQEHEKHLFDSSGGGKRTRTPGILLAKQALYQLSYTPIRISLIYTAIKLRSQYKISFVVDASGNIMLF
jgi:hypothetical protein